MFTFSIFNYKHIYKSQNISFLLLVGIDPSLTQVLNCSLVNLSLPEVRSKRCVTYVINFYFGKSFIFLPNVRQFLYCYGYFSSPFILNTFTPIEKLTRLEDPTLVYHRRVNSF